MSILKVELKCIDNTGQDDSDEPPYTCKLPN